jgi:hypothetical protein
MVNDLKRPQKYTFYKCVKVKRSIKAVPGEAYQGFPVGRLQNTV